MAEIAYGIPRQATPNIHNACLLKSRVIPRTFYGIYKTLTETLFACSGNDNLILNDFYFLSHGLLNSRLMGRSQGRGTIRPYDYVLDASDTYNNSHLAS